MNAATSIQGSEHRFQLLVEAVQEYSIYMLDPEGRITTWNMGAERMKGYTATEIIGKSFECFFLPEDLAAGAPQKALATARETGRYEGEGWRVRKDGSTLWVSVVINAIRDTDGTLLGFAKVTRDMTMRREQEAALRASEAALQAEKELLQVTLYSIGDGVISTDLAMNIKTMNQAAELMTGWMLSEAAGRPLNEVFRLVDPETGAPLVNLLEECLAEKSHFHMDTGVGLLGRSGVQWAIQPSWDPIRARNGEILGAVVVFHDVTALQSAQRNLEFHTNYDMLTSLPNRQQFQSTLKDVLERPDTPGQNAICFLALDRFKIINDTAGHGAGDLLLRTVGHLLTQYVHGPELVARLGGDEFAMILRDCTVEQAQATVTKMLEAIEGLHFHWEERIFRTSASAGLAMLTAGSDAADAMKQADLACYAAKRAGRNRISVYRADQSEGYTRYRELQVASEIRDAIMEDRFTLYGQKIVGLNGDNAPRYELLLRMRDRKGGIMSPAEFIPAAERYDLMGDVDRWVMERVLKYHAAEFASIPNLQLSVNVSANSLNDAKFLPYILKLIAESVLPPTALTMEITETSLINNLTSANSIIEALRATGCKVALDDFGIGLCSFSYLRSFKVDYIKIDGDFVRNMVSSPVDFSIVRAINNIAHEMLAQTIAEYVEDDAILSKITELGVDFAQGYGLGRPAPVEELLLSCPDRIDPIGGALQQAVTS
ncbi:MAG TPA: EAL domain-containing protein [Acidobacteriaceae bacterium]